LEKSGELPEIDVLLAAIEKQARASSWCKDGGQFIPHPATWLNGAQWENEDTAACPAEWGSNLAAQYGE